MRYSSFTPTELEHTMTNQQIAAALTKIEASMNSVADASRVAVLSRAVADDSYRPVQVQAAVEYAATWL